MVSAYPIKALTRQVGSLLVKQSARLITVESCTGGGIGYFCTAEPGASAWYQGGYVTYHNEEKIRLGVSAALIKRYGAVSLECAEALATAALAKHPQNTYILTVTGIAGPTGGTKQKPIGTVFFCWLAASRKKSAHCVFSGNRESIRIQAVIYALGGLIDLVEQDVEQSLAE